MLSRISENNPIVYKRIVQILILFFIGLIFSWLILKIWVWVDPPKLEISYSKEVLYSDGSQMHVFLSPDQKWRLEASKGQIPARMSNWIEWKEDRFFRYHPGFNPVSIVRSFWNLARTGQRQSGASTISMQIVRLKTQQERSWKSKFSELGQAILLESAYSKDRLFAHYVNHLPFGGNVEGFRAASQIYFGREPADLTTGQMAALIVIPNHPGKFHPIKNTAALLKKRNSFLDKLYKAEKISSSDWKSARLEPLFPTWHQLPKAAPHLANYIISRPENPIRTNIDRNIQAQMQLQMVQFSHSIKRMGIPNAALLVANYHTGEIVSWIGNPDHSDKENSGEVDGVRAVRSPGSTLKPFIYALGLQKGWITPASVLYDIPQDFAGYQPENYDQKFRGEVTAEGALLQSLNLPAIGLLKEIGIDSFLAFTDRLGMKTFRQKTEKPGLSVAVGGCSATLFELVQAYAALANNGKMAKIHSVKVEKSELLPTNLTPESAEMVRSILAVGKRGEAILPFVKDRLGYGRICWKTGTSFGRRDAWCIGFGNKYVVGLWLGDFKGQGNAALSGVDMASPQFQRLILSIEKPNNRIPLDSFLTQLGWRIRKVCRVSGQIRSDYCLSQTSDWFLPLVSNVTICSHVKPVLVNQLETISYCIYCQPETGFHTKICDNRPPAILNYLHGTKELITPPPPHNPSCRMARESSSLVILSPADGKEYFLEGKDSVALGIRLYTLSENFPVSAFVNGKKIGKSISGESILHSFRQGKYRMTLVDNAGQSATSSFVVRDF